MSGINVLLKTPTKYREFFPTLFVKTTDSQLAFNFEQTSIVTKFGGRGIMALVIFLDFHSTKQGLPLPLILVHVTLTKIKCIPIVIH